MASSTMIVSPLLTCCPSLATILKTLPAVPHTTGSPFPFPPPDLPAAFLGAGAAALAGAAGAAAATVFGQGVAFICAVVYLYKRRDEFGFDFKLKSFIPDKGILKTLLRLGIPMALQTCAINLSNLFVNSFINGYGLVASAVTGVGNKINNIATIVTHAVSAAGSSMIGQNYAAGKKKRVVKIVGTAVLLPEPPSSTITVMHICGFSVGANPVNQA